VYGPKTGLTPAYFSLSRALEWLELLDVSVGRIHSKKISVNYWTKSKTRAELKEPEHQIHHWFKAWHSWASEGFFPGGSTGGFFKNFSMGDQAPPTLRFRRPWWHI